MGSEPALAVGEDASHCGCEHRDGVNVLHCDVGGVLLEEDHVGELAGNQEPFTCVLAGYLAGALGGGPDRLPGREALVRSVRKSVFGDALDERLDPAEGGAGSDGSIGAERDRQAGVQKAACAV